MPRRPRQDAPGWFHHVWNRGQSQRSVFDGSREVRHFLAQVARQVRAGRIQIHAYCLLTNHYHLLIQSVTGELSIAMARIQNAFVRSFNRERGRTGSLFEGRFASHPVLSDAYWHALHAYIDANSVTADIVTNATLYPAGSAWHYARAGKPIWLTRSRIEAIVATNLRKAAFEPDLYALWCDGIRNEEALRLVQVRMRHPTFDSDPLDALRQGRDHVRAWLISRTLMADGRDLQPPLATAERIMEVLEIRQRAHASWQVVPAKRAKPAWLVISVGILSRLGKVRRQDVARRLNIAVGSVHVYLQDFDQLVQTDDAFAATVTDLISAIMR